MSALAVPEGFETPPPIKTFCPLVSQIGMAVSPVAGALPQAVNMIFQCPENKTENPDGSPAPSCGFWSKKLNKCAVLALAEKGVLDD